MVLTVRLFTGQQWVYMVVPVKGASLQPACHPSAERHPPDRIKVDDGILSATVNARDAIAIHRGAVAPISLTFQVTATTSTGESVFVVGNQEALGNWNPSHALPLVKSAASSMWTLSVQGLKPNTAINYKYIKKGTGGLPVIWETTGDRTYALGSTDATTDPQEWGANLPAVKVTFQVVSYTTYGQEVYVVGNLPPLGNWDIEHAVSSK